MCREVTVDLACIVRFGAPHRYLDARESDTRQHTGAATEATGVKVFEELKKDGVIDTANELGYSVRELTKLVLSNDKAFEASTGAIWDRSLRLRESGDDEMAGRVVGLLGSLREQRRELEYSQTQVRQEARAKKGAADATRDFHEVTSETAQALREEAEAANKVRIAHNKLVDAFTAAKEGQIGLEQAIDEAAQEARKGARTLDISTQAGRDNYNALLDVASGWNDLPPKLKNAKGAYRDLRQQFIALAEDLGASDEKARRLADRLLDLPKKKIRIPVELDVMNPNLTAQLRLERLQGFATGGRVPGMAPSTGDNVLVAARSGEWIVQDKAARYYGDAFMRAINEMRLPRYASGGSVGPVMPRQPVAAGVQVNIGTVVAHDYADFMRQMTRRARLAASAGGA
jgi:hypothetical protein